MNTKTVQGNMVIMIVAAILGSIVKALHLEFSDADIQSVATISGPFIVAIGVAAWNLWFTEGGVKDQKKVEK